MVSIRADEREFVKPRPMLPGRVSCSVRTSEPRCYQRCLKGPRHASAAEVHHLASGIQGRPPGVWTRCCYCSHGYIPADQGGSGATMDLS